MGATKRWLEEEEARGFSSGNHSLICSNHLADYALKQFIEQKGKSGKCDYCEDSQESNVVIFDQLMEVIVEGIRNHYGTPDDEGVPYSSEYGYWADTYDTDDLIRWHLQLEADNEDIVDEIIDAIGRDTLWCLHWPDSPRHSQILTYNWKLFCQMLRHKVRYVFFKYPKKVKTEFGKVDPSSILDKIGKAIVGLGLFHNTEKELFNGIRAYRARQHEKKERVKECKALGPLSFKKAKSANRFSPPGIPMFYGAKNKDTAILEIINKAKKNQVISTAIFKNVKPLNLIDLTNIPDVSVFDLAKAELYEASIFLKAFSKAISKKIKKGDSQHFEYVPTQVVTEYFRHVLAPEAGIKIDGLIYKSAVDKNEDCYVIFCDSRHCRDEGRQTKRTVLVLEKDSFERVRVKDFKKSKKKKR